MKTAFARRDIDVGPTPWNDIWQRSDGAIKARLRFDRVALSQIANAFPRKTSRQMGRRGMLLP